MIFAGIGFGFHKAAKEQKRLEQGIAIKRMLYLLQGEIRYGFTPIEQLDDQIFLMKDQVVKNCKMYRSLGISLSVLIVIILL